MAYVVSATWTAQPGTEDVVLDAIEKLTPLSARSPATCSTRPTRTPRSPRLPSLRDLRRRGGVRRPRRVGHFKEFALEQAIPVLTNRERAFFQTIG